MVLNVLLNKKRRSEIIKFISSKIKEDVAPNTIHGFDIEEVINAEDYFKNSNEAKEFLSDCGINAITAIQRNRPYLFLGGVTNKSLISDSFVLLIANALVSIICQEIVDMSERVCDKWHIKLNKQDLKVIIKEIEGV
jgi:hypothetical protein